jgi:uncharacterized cupin superfamily protein
VSALPPRPVINALTVELEPDPTDPPGFQARYGRLGPLLGAGALLGGTVHELDPGERTSPYHYEIGNEECVLVLTGTPVLRHPSGRDELVAGDLVAFADGEAGAHQLINDSTEPARVLIFSTKHQPAASAYPDSGKVGTPGGVFRIADAVDYWDGETAG